MRRSRWLERVPHRLHELGVATVAWHGALVVALVSVLWTAVLYPDVLPVTAVVALAAVAAFGLRRSTPMSLAAAGPGAAVALATTSSEVFSLWPAAAGLLVMVMLDPGRRPAVSTSRLVAAGALAVGGLGWWLVDQTRPVGPQLLSAAVAVLVVGGTRRLGLALGAWVELQEQHAALQVAAAAAAESNLELRRRQELARELHDSIGHHLTAMVVQAEAGQVTSPSPALELIGDLGRDALEELEAVLFDLRNPDHLDLSRLHSHLAEPLRAGGVVVEVQVSTELRGPAAGAVYRIVQEALTNVMRHARARNVEVVVRDEAEGVVLVAVRDDGVGAAVDGVGSGIAGMRARARELGGELVVRDLPTGGTLVEARLRGDTR